MMLSYFEDLAGGIQRKLQVDPASASPTKTRALEVARLGARLYSGRHRVAWCGVCAPFDLLNAMDVTPCFVEWVGAMLAATGGVGPVLEHAEQQGYSTDGCSYHRSVTGAALRGLMPRPDFLVATSAPCSGGLATMENLARIFGRDLFVLDIPARLDEAGVRYLAGQLEEMVRFVERHTGQPLDPARLSQAVEQTNSARLELQRLYELAARIPSPVRSRDLANLALVQNLFLGREEGVRIAREFRQEYEARVARAEAGVPGERFRLLWIQNRIQFNTPVLELLEQRYQASVVVDELNSVYWDAMDPQDPLPGMARRMIGLPLNGVAEHRLRHARDLASRYQVHGAINPCNWGCRQGAGARGMMQQALGELGVPVLNLEMDCVDDRNFAEGQVRTRLEAFMELLESRHG